MTAPMPEWPKHPNELYPPEFNANSDYWRAAMHDYHRNRAEAAIARLKVAVDALKRHTSHYDCEDCWYSCATLICDDRRKSDECDCGAQSALDALSTIGDIPEDCK